MEWTGVVYVEGKKPFPKCVTNPGECWYNPLTGCGSCEKGVRATTSDNGRFISASRRFNPDF